jgi:S1-C subfamily serine protease
MAIAAKGRAIAVGTVVSRREFAGRREQLIEDALVVTPARADCAGAALVDGSGRLVGVGSRERFAGDGGAPGNVFIPVEAFQRPLAGVLRADAGRAPRRPWLGLVLAEPPVPLAIEAVDPGSPAERGGVRPGDVVLAVNGDAVATRAALYRRLWREQPGATIALTVQRDGSTRILRVRTIDRQNYLIHRARGMPPAGPAESAHQGGVA